MLWFRRNVFHEVCRHLRRHGRCQSRERGRDRRRIRDCDRPQLSAAHSRNLRQTPTARPHHSSCQHLCSDLFAAGEVVSTTPAQRFLRDAAEKSADLVHRELIRRGMDSYDAAHLKGRARIKDWEAARQQCREIKREAINHLDRYLLQFEEKVISHGGHVFWAANGEEACAYVTDLATRFKVRTIVKSKSMVTEEIHLSPALEKAGIKVWETDFGEYIVQLREEPPYHIVTPAMHLNRGQIAKLFREKVDPAIDSDDPAYLMAAARRKLRQAFFDAEMGISGANFLVADAGVVAISTNEGNGRLCTSVPRIHVVVTGIEKAVLRLEDLAVLLPVLATSGTGQGYNTISTRV